MPPLGARADQGGRGFSLGKGERPAGTVTMSVVSVVKSCWTGLKLSH
jgi:hypothetical protein